MHTVFALLCFVLVIHWLIFPYPSGLLHWHCGNLTIAPVPAKQPWWIWINTSCEFIMNDCITTTKQSTTKPCAYFLGYTVDHSGVHYGDNSHGAISWQSSSIEDRVPVDESPICKWVRVHVSSMFSHLHILYENCVQHLPRTREAFMWKSSQVMYAYRIHGNSYQISRHVASDVLEQLGDRIKIYIHSSELTTFVSLIFFHFHFLY